MKFLLKTWAYLLYFRARDYCGQWLRWGAANPFPICGMDSYYNRGHHYYWGEAHLFIGGSRVTFLEGSSNLGQRSTSAAASYYSSIVTLTIVEDIDLLTGRIKKEILKGRWKGFPIIMCLMSTPSDRIKHAHSGQKWKFEGAFTYCWLSRSCYNSYSEWQQLARDWRDFQQLAVYGIRGHTREVVEIREGLIYH